MLARIAFLLAQFKTRLVIGTDVQALFLVVLCYYPRLQLVLRNPPVLWRFDFG